VSFARTFHTDKSVTFTARLAVAFSMLLPSEQKIFCTLVSYRIYYEFGIWKTAVCTKYNTPLLFN